MGAGGFLIVPAQLTTLPPPSPLHGAVQELQNNVETAKRVENKTLKLMEDALQYNKQATALANAQPGASKPSFFGRFRKKQALRD